MIDWDDFEYIVKSELDRDISNSSNSNQSKAIRVRPDQSLFLVAGPGSGKTTVITLKVLKLIFVDDVDPLNILLTTFTRKAAAELRSRVLGWGDQLRHAFIEKSSYSNIKTKLQRLDFNRINTGTLDSISEENLREYRTPGVPPPVIIEDFVLNAFMLRVGLFANGRYRNQDLLDYIKQLAGSTFGVNIVKTLREIKDRFFHDQINVDLFRRRCNHSGIEVACGAIDDYNQELQDRLLFDFARLESEFLERLNDTSLNEFLKNIRFILVDEYQDTNLLQEQIYFEIAKAALKNGGSITVVGDDDQSLYRFRGATVDLFKIFTNRIYDNLAVNPEVLYLSQNYRSTSNIIHFVNDFITLDTQFQNARVIDKPRIEVSRSTALHPYIDYPVLGLFRKNVGALARDLSQFCHKIIHGKGFQIKHQGKLYTIKINPELGSSTDIAVLCSSPRELDSAGNPRLPLLLDNELSNLTPPIQVFNPRGQNLERISEVQILCGLILECIDPDGIVQNSITTLQQAAVRMLNHWRDEAISYINSNPSPVAKINLRKFVNAWQNRTPLHRKIGTREEIPLLDLVYKLVTWIPSMQNDIEGLVYLEAITRTISQSALFGKFGAEIIFDPSNPSSELEQASIKEALWNIFMPLATGIIEIDEDLLETLPSDRINIMSVHQAKGLEFPLVIVDIGSDFRTDHWKQAFKRFPRLNNKGKVDGVKSLNIEDELRPYSPLGESSRSCLDRAFDDLIRHYFVAFSRAQDVLLLVGLNSIRDGIPNIATGWDRNQKWHWNRLTNIVHI